mmetsp:Transcript_42777/g.118137  ORF Transcript_42777/g.118137 Transcript_42777/m.118137 type:complete len:725 (+) Transcript_42777:335-2509(+)
MLRCVGPLQRAVAATWRGSRRNPSATGWQPVSGSERGVQSPRVFHGVRSRPLHDGQLESLRRPAQFTGLLKSFGAKGDWEGALELLQRMRGGAVLPDVICYTAAVSVCGRAHQWAWALALLKDLRLRRLLPSAVTLAVATMACEKGRQWESAVALLAETSRHQVRPDVVNFNVVAGACARSWQWVAAWALLESMAGFRLKPDLVGINAALDATGRARQWVACLSALMGVRSRGITPDIISYSSLLIAFGNSHRWQDALSCVELARGSSVAPDLVSFNIAADACKAAGQWQHALALLDTMRSCRLSPDIVSYGSVIGAGGQGDVSIKLLREAVSSRVTPNMISVGAAITACRSIQHWQQALVLLHLALEARARMDSLAYNMALGACEEGSFWEGAIAIMSAMRRDAGGAHVDAVSINTVMSACKSAHRWTEALIVFETVLAERGVASPCWDHASLEVLRGDGLAPDVVSFNTAISSCSEGSEWRTALSLLGAMSQYMIAPDPVSHAATISALGRAVRWEHALVLFEDAVLQRRLSPGHGYQYNAAIAACERGLQWRGAVAMLARMRQERVNFTTDGTASYFPAISAAAQASSADVASALYEEAIASGACPVPPRREPGRLLDLHGMGVDVAKVAVRSELRLAAFSDARKLGDLVLIIGMGHGSGDDGPLVGPAILQMLGQERPSLEASPVPGNAGRLRIHAEALERWVAQRRAETSQKGCVAPTV